MKELKADFEYPWSDGYFAQILRNDTDLGRGLTMLELSRLDVRSHAEYGSVSITPIRDSLPQEDASLTPEEFGRRFMIG